MMTDASCCTLLFDRPTPALDPHLDGDAAPGFPLDGDRERETRLFRAADQFGEVAGRATNSPSEGSLRNVVVREEARKLVHGPLIANSEQGVKRHVRHLRRAFTNSGQYQCAMRLKLRELRERLGWTQEKVASLAGMSKSFYSEIESGKKAANSRRLNKFAEVFGVPPFELIDDASLDDELLAHIQVLHSLPEQDRAAVIRHALGLANDKAPHE